MARPLIAVVTLIGFSGCASTATITRTDGTETEAAIERSDAEALYVRGESGPTQRIARESVQSIDHPGNVALVAGALLFGLFTAFAIDYRNSPNGQVILPPTVVLGAPGVAVARAS